MLAPFRATALGSALDLIEELAADRRHEKRVVEAREAIQQALALVESRTRVRCIPELAHLVGLSPETVRRKLLRMFPEAKRGSGRYHITPEMVDAILADA